MKKMKKGLSRLWPLLVFALCLAVSVGVYWVYGEHNLDSDISSEFLLAQLLNEEGKLVTDSWFYSTELRIVSPVPVYQLALRLFSDWHAARTFSIAVLLCGVAASLCYLATGLGASSAASLLCAAALILPVTPYNSFTLVYGGFYTGCVILTFVELGLVLRMDKRRWREPVLLILLGVWGGLGGVRMLMVCVAPLLMAGVLAFYLEARRCESLRQAVSRPEARIAAGSLLCTAATLVGYLINENVLSRMFWYEQFDETTLRALTPEMLTDQLQSLMSFFGYRGDVLLLSREGLVSVFAVALPVLCAAAIVLLLRMELSPRERMLAIFIPAALAVGILINVLTIENDGTTTYNYSVSYYMPAALLMVFSLFWALDRFACRLRGLRVAPMLALVAMFLLGNAAYRDLELNKTSNELEQIAQVLLEEDCTTGYATFWNANVLTELSDGKIDVYMVESWEQGNIGEWLQRTDHFDFTPGEGRIFAIFDQYDMDHEVPACDANHMAFSTGGKYVCIYDSYEEFSQYSGL